MAVDDDQALIVVVDALSHEVIAHAVRVLSLYYAIADVGGSVADGIVGFSGRSGGEREVAFERCQRFTCLHGIKTAAVAMLSQHIDGEGSWHLCVCITELQVVVSDCRSRIALLQVIRSSVALDDDCRIAGDGCNGR